MSFRSTPKILVAIVAFAVLLIAVGEVASYYKPPDAPAPSRAELEQAARAEVARNQEAGRRAKEEGAKQKADTRNSSGNPFDTDSGRTLMLGLFIQPVLKQMLSDPESLQDLEISSVNRLKGEPTFPSCCSISCSKCIRWSCGSAAGIRYCCERRCG
jgi:hypothetical protein